jgi:hypothetical protein
METTKMTKREISVAVLHALENIVLELHNLNSTLKTMNNTSFQQQQQQQHPHHDEACAIVSLNGINDGDDDVVYVDQSLPIETTDDRLIDLDDENNSNNNKQKEYECAMSAENREQNTSVDMWAPDPETLDPNPGFKHPDPREPRFDEHAHHPVPMHYVPPEMRQPKIIIPPSPPPPQTEYSNSMESKLLENAINE